MESVKRKKSLRSKAIDYSLGRFFVTSQVSFNKSIFGAIVGGKCVLNELGKRVEEYWRGMPDKYPEMVLGDFVVMPNHFHAVVKIRRRSGNREHHLGFLMSRFKGGTGYIYGKMKEAGMVDDIGEHLWQYNYWDDLITDAEMEKAVSGYIRNNPSNWSRDRYGACTAHMMGDARLLELPRVAFVASHGFLAESISMRKLWSDGTVGQKAIISTFTSAQEREMMRRALRNGRKIIHVIPQGIPEKSELAPGLSAAVEDGRLLMISPQETESSLNKKAATWCNEYVLRHANEIWTGDIAPNGMLQAMLGELLGK